MKRTDDLFSFYEKLNSSSINFLNQNKPGGFGDAVLRSEPYIQDQFIVQAGDNIFLSEGNRHLQKLVIAQWKYKSCTSFLVKEVKDPGNFGKMEGKKVERDIYQVERVVEEFVFAGPFYVLNMSNGNPIIIETNTRQMEEGAHYRPAPIFGSVDRWLTNRPGTSVEMPEEIRNMVRDRMLGIFFSQSFDITVR